MVPCCRDKKKEDVDQINAAQLKQLAGVSMNITGHQISFFFKDPGRICGCQIIGISREEAKRAKILRGHVEEETAFALLRPTGLFLSAGLALGL